MAKAQTQGAPEGKGKPVKALVMVLGLLIAEAALLIGVMLLIGGEPDVAAAGETFPEAELAESEKIVEILVLDGKLPNAKTGVTYVYDTEIYVQVKQKHAERIGQELGQFYNEIKADLTAIWRTSDPQHFQEPKLENLTRKVYALLNDRFGVNQEDGEPILVKCVIVMGTGFRVDS